MSDVEEYFNSIDSSIEDMKEALHELNKALEFAKDDDSWYEDVENIIEVMKAKLKLLEDKHGQNK